MHIYRGKYIIFFHKAIEVGLHCCWFELAHPHLAVGHLGPEFEQDLEDLRQVHAVPVVRIFREFIDPQKQE